MIERATPNPPSLAAPTPSDAEKRQRILGDAADAYPFESHFIERDGTRQHYVDVGSGPPVVMVHGNPTWSFYFRELIAELSKDHRVIAPDHIGCGLSDTPTDDVYDYHFDERARDLESLLEALDVRENVTLVLHDWGGMIGMRYATKYPGRIARLVLLNTAAFLLPIEKSFPLRLVLARSNRLGAFLVRGLNLFCREAARMGCKRRKLEPEVARALVAPYDTWEERRAIHRFVQDIPLRPSDRGYDVIEEITRGLEAFRGRPTQIHWGRKDFVFDDAFLAEWKRQLPSADFRVFDDCGHYILEDARSEVVTAVRGFVDANPLPWASGAESPR